MTTNKLRSDRLANWILLGLAFGIVAGLAGRGLIAALPATKGALLWFAQEVCDPVGTVFLRLLFFVVVPLVFSSLALGVVQLGRLDRLGPLAGRTFGLFALNMAIGVALGLILMNAVNPGGRLDDTTKNALLDQFRESARTVQQKAAAQEPFGLRSLVEMFMPQNLLLAVVQFQMLPMILFALLVGAAGTTLSDKQHAGLKSALEMTVDLMTRMVHWALLLAPWAVPAMIYSVIIKFGAGLLGALFLFVGVVLGGILIHLFGTMSLLLRAFTHRSPTDFFRAIKTILVTAFSTSSSNATLPTTIQVSRENLGIRASTAGFVLPLGATMNMSGTALYEGCVVLFVAQVYQVDLTLANQTTLLFLAVLSAVAVAGIPGGSLPLLVGLLTTFGLPAEGIALILGTDRLLDMARTVLNVSADVVTACIVDEHMPAEPE